MVWRSNPGEGEGFPTHPDRPRDSLSLLYKGTGPLSQGGNRVGVALTTYHLPSILLLSSGSVCPVTRRNSTL